MITITEDAYNILEHLKKHGPVDTFRLARKLGMDRNKLLNIIKELKEKELVEFKEGTVKFLKFPEEIKVEKNKVKEVSSEIKEELPEETRKPAPLEDPQAENKNLGGESWRSELEKTIKELEQKVKEVSSEIKEKLSEETRKPAPLEDPQAENKKFRERLFRKEITKKKKKEREEQKTKAPKFNLTRLKDNLTKLNKNIQQLRVPKILKKEVDKNV
jgi:predicted transcriptional regulator